MPVSDEKIEEIVLEQAKAVDKFAMSDRIEIVCRIIARRAAQAVRSLCAEREKEALEWGMLWDDGESLSFYTSSGAKILPEDFDKAYADFLRSQGGGTDTP